MNIFSTQAPPATRAQVTSWAWLCHWLICSKSWRHNICKPHSSIYSYSYSLEFSPSKLHKSALAAIQCTITALTHSSVYSSEPMTTCPDKNKLYCWGSTKWEDRCMVFSAHSSINLDLSTAKLRHVVFTNPVNSPTSNCPTLCEPIFQGRCHHKLKDS